MRSRILTACALALVAGCVDPDPGPLEPEGEPATGTAAEELLGETCATLTCAPGQCGVVPDGCRSEMWCGDCACGPTARACERAVSPVFDAALSAGAFVIATTNLSAGADPVIHVLDGTGREVAFDDNSGGNGNAVVSGTLASAGRVIVRARSAGTAGTATLHLNGKLVSIAFGGTFQTMTGLRVGERVESVKLFGSVIDAHFIYVLASDGVHLVTRVVGGGTAGGAVWTSTIAGTATVVFGSTGADPQPARLMRNDVALAQHDADADGLGNELEAALGTCASTSVIATGPDGVQYDCALASDARDTDGDGLSDGVEVMGVRTAFPHQPLPLWGADPRHKDLFAEIDTSQLVAGGPVPMLTPADARRFSDYYGDRTQVLTPFVALYHAASLENPNQKRGIRTHLDIGVPPQSPADARLYGNWSGWSVVPPAPGGGGQSPRQALATYLAPVRLGVFRYALWYDGGGGQTPTSEWCLGCGAYGWSSGNEIDTFTHESIHAHGLAHSGPAKAVGVDPNCKAAYPSIVNYAFQGAGYGLSDGLGFTGTNNARATEWQAVAPSMASVLVTLQNVFGYRVDFTQGHVDWNRDGVFAPAGTTVRAYTNYLRDQGCEFTRYNSEQLSTALNTRVSPAFGRHGSTTFLFSGGTTSLRYVTAASPFACTATSTTPCVTWSAPQTLAMDATRGVDATRVSTGLLVVTVGADGRLYSAVRRTVGWLQTWTTPTLIPGADAATGEPSLVSLPDGAALLLYRRASGELVEARFAQTSAKSPGAWVRLGLARKDDGTSIAHAEQAAPGLVSAAFTGIGPRTYALFAMGADAVLELWQYDAATQRWAPSPIPLEDSIHWWRSASGGPRWCGCRARTTRRAAACTSSPPRATGTRRTPRCAARVAASSCAGATPRPAPASSASACSPAIRPTGATRSASTRGSIRGSTRTCGSRGRSRRSPTPAIQPSTRASSSTRRAMGSMTTPRRT